MKTHVRGPRAFMKKNTLPTVFLPLNHHDCKEYHIKGKEYHKEDINYCVFLPLNRYDCTNKKKEYQEGDTESQRRE